MEKIRINTALERQIPEHIREEYKTFVKFLKVYYEFIDQNNGRQLENIRSIDKTLDQFVDYFKKELAASVPTRNLPNERAFLEHIKDFYNSRGSKQSYELLFRILYNSDVDIYYPSEQVMRVSDGKWVQDKSVFVKTTSGNLGELRGKIITVETAKKSLSVYCPNVIFYRDDVYEVFIDKQYYSDIGINDEVYFGNNRGTILPCPAKYSVITEGSGFEIGAIYNLPTQEGNGSTIKITKVGPNGEIKNIQVVTFGLDYKTNFYAKLSNKTHKALIYYHPISEYIAGEPRDEDLEPRFSYGPNPANEEAVADYINFGYFIEQNYLYYDIAYEPNNYNAALDQLAPDMLQTNWYVDTTYVGDVVASFYTNEAGAVIDETTAEIRIQLGPVAVYPGYYETNDGFISDEIYIQDGQYYQLFSYVLKAEETIDTYRDIVKSLLHPSGLKLYGQYNISNNFDVVPSPLFAYIRRQYIDYFELDDIYDLITKFDIDKQIQEVISSNTLGDKVFKNLSKIMEQELFAPPTDLPAKSIVKSTIDEELEFIDTEISRSTIGSYNDNAITSESALYSFAVAYQSSVTPTISGITWDFSSEEDGTFYSSLEVYESSSKSIRPNIDDGVPSPTDSFNRTVEYSRRPFEIVNPLEIHQFGINKISSDSQTITELLSRTVQYYRTFIDEQEIQDIPYKSFITGVNDSISAPTDSFDRTADYLRRPFEIVNSLDSYLSSIAPVFAETQASTDIFTRSVNYSRVISDVQDIIDEAADFLKFNKDVNVSEEQVIQEHLDRTVNYIRSILDNQLAIEVPYKTAQKTLEESISNITEGLFLMGFIFNREFSDNLNIGNALEVLFNSLFKNVVDSANIGEEVSLNSILRKTDQTTSISVYSSSLSKPVAEDINNSMQGTLYADPYNLSVSNSSSISSDYFSEEYEATTTRNLNT